MSLTVSPKTSAVPAKHAAFPRPRREAAGAASFAGKLASNLVSAQAHITPQALAVVCGDNVLTYGALETESNRLANYLVSLGVGPEVLVGLCLERSTQMVVGALGILKAGGAYVPIDPSYPRERIEFILHDSQASALVTQRGVADGLNTKNCRMVATDTEAAQIAVFSCKAPASRATEEHLAYVIYTSGTTGQPKGVEITHRNLLNLVSWHQQAFSVTATDRVTQMASLGFDAAVWELWPYLTAGASIHIVDDTTRMHPEALRDWLAAQRISVSFVPTPIAERMIRLPWPSRVGLRFLLTGADTLHHYPSRELPFVLVNNYGPTECTVVATSGAVPPNDNPDIQPPIGRPIANAEIYILDEELRPVPIGSEGQLYVGGAGVGRGYRNRPELTAERFIPHPFSGNGHRLYRTGDLARWLPDGQIAFLGRSDDQIKIRGFRIEPNEIVSLLSAHPAIEECAVVARGDAPGEERLVAYIVANSQSRPTETELKAFLRARLPEYMVPAVFVLLESLPLTSNGKVDRGALPSPGNAKILREEVEVVDAPRTLCEQRLAAILAALLELPQVGVHDNFFMLGGHSLLGTQLIARVRDAFGVELSLRVLFDNPTVAGLSEEIEKLILAKIEALQPSQPAIPGLQPQPAAGD